MADNMPDVGDVLQDADDDLEMFRNQWKRELDSQKTDAADGDGNVEVQHAEKDIEQRARDLFMKGVESEQDGKLYEAISYYKKAEKLVPNIELQAYKYSGKSKVCTNNKNNQAEAVDDNGNVPQDGGEEEEIANLSYKFSKLFPTGQTSIRPEFETNQTHIGQLPSEVINYILKWVVSSDLDFKSLESCSQVCRGLYVASRDDDIWRLVSLKLWGPAVLSANVFPSWRDLFLARPRVHFSGVYISKMRYIREGERGFQDENYRAWHVVEYRRFLRFFPSGQVIMAISSDDEAIISKQLNSKAGGANIPGAMMGQYRISDNVVVIVFHVPRVVAKKIRHKKKGRRDDWDGGYSVPDRDFHLEFFIAGSQWRQLEWKHYDLVNKYSNGNESVETFQIKDQNKYPIIRYKPVSSYQFESQSPLS